MTLDSEKTEKKLRMISLALQSLTKGVWEFVGETATALTQVMGDDILKILEQDMGLQIQGKKPEEVLNQIGRIMVEKFNVIDNYECHQDDHKITIKVNNCILSEFDQELMKAGVTKPFICPISNACQAALRRLNLKISREIHLSPTGDCTYIFEIMA